MSTVRVQSADHPFISTEVTTMIQTPHCGVISRSKSRRKTVVEPKSPFQGAFSKYFKLLEQQIIFLSDK